MSVLFTHACPHCGRRRRMHLNLMGTRVRCVSCNRVSVATDPHNESLAMLDPLKLHAELSDLEEDPMNRPYRTPR